MKKGLGWYIVLLIGYTTIIVLSIVYFIHNIINDVQAGQIVETIVSVVVGLGLGTLLAVAHYELKKEK